MRATLHILMALALLLSLCSGASSAMRDEDNPDIFGFLESAAAPRDDTAKLLAQSNLTTSDQSSLTSSPLSQTFNIKVESFIKQDVHNLHLNDSIDFVIRVSWQGRLGDVIVDTPDAPELVGFRSVYVIPSNRTSPETNIAIAEFNYVLEPTAKGEASIGAVNIRYSMRGSGEGGVLRTQRTELHILPARRAWGKIIAGTIALLTLLILGLIGFVRGGAIVRKRAAKVPEEPSPSPYQKILGEIESMKLMLVEGELKGFYDRVFELMRGVLSLGTNAPLTKLTAEELSHYIAESKLPEQNRSKALKILERCESVRFGGYSPTYAENEDILKDLRTFVEMQSNIENLSSEEKHES